VGGTKDPDLAAVAALGPDLVVMCEEENRREDAEALAVLDIPTHTLRIRAVGDVGPAIADLAGRLGLGARWSPPRLPAPPPRPPRRAFVPIWRERRVGQPTAYTTLSDDTYGASLLAALGILDVFGDAAERYPETTLAEAAARGAEVVLAPSEPYPFGPRHAAELEAVAPVLFVDGQDLFWWGARTAAALERLARRLADPTG